ncbi:branched-chain amino acid ABC transporter permease [Nitrospirota bacterium]
MNRYIQVAIVLVIGVVIQLGVQAAGANYYLTQLTMASYYILVVTGLTMLMGYAGQISLGHAGFFAMGGYISAVMTTYNLMEYKSAGIVKIFSSIGLMVERQGLYGETILHFHPWVACITAVAFTVLVAYLLGGPVLKLRGHYLAMATLGFGVIVHRVVIGSAIFGEADGIHDVPGFELLPGLIVSGKAAVRTQNFYIAWVMAALGMLLMLNLVKSRVGRALRSIHGAEDAANSMGVDTAKYKLKIFVVSAAFAAVAGVFLTHFNGGIGPSEASIIKSVRYVAIVAVGGMANLWGAFIMGMVLNYLSLRGNFGSYDDAVFGGILIVIMLFAPNGLLRKYNLAFIKSFFSRKTEEGA